MRWKALNGGGKKLVNFDIGLIYAGRFLFILQVYYSDFYVVTVDSIMQGRVPRRGGGRLGASWRECGGCGGL